MDKSYNVDKDYNLIDQSYYIKIILFIWGSYHIIARQPSKSFILTTFRKPYKILVKSPIPSPVFELKQKQTQAVSSLPVVNCLRPNIHKTYLGLPQICLFNLNSLALERYNMGLKYTITLDLLGLTEKWMIFVQTSHQRKGSELQPVAESLKLWIGIWVPGFYMLNRKFPDNNDNVVDIVPEKTPRRKITDFLTISQERSDPLLTDEHV